MQEEWRPVPCYEGLYEVSDRGRVRSLDRIAIHTNQYGEYRKQLYGKQLNPVIHHTGYSVVSLCRDGEQISKRVHVLVAEAFLGKAPANMQTMHLDGDKENNKLSNLRYGTPLENNSARVAHGKSLVGIKNHKAKLVDENILEIRNDQRSQYKLAKIYGVSPAAISAVKLRKTWRHV